MSKNALYITLLGVIFISLVGCQTNKRIPSTFNMNPKSSWPDQHRNVAMQSYIYAQMANNTYGQGGDEYDSDGLDFVLPEIYTVKHYPNDDIGLAYSIYEKKENGQLTEVVLVFRGTEGFTDWDDFWYGNITAQQNVRAIEKYKTLRSSLNKKGLAQVPITLAGHSLGGALAIHVALNSEELIPYYVFNSSPRFKLVESWETSRDKKKLFKSRYSIVETGEVLYAVRFPATEATQTYQPMNCEKHFQPTSSHGIEKLAECLTKVAGLNDPKAKVKKQPKLKVSF